VVVKRDEPSLWYATITDLNRISVFLVSYYLVRIYFSFISFYLAAYFDFLEY